MAIILADPSPVNPRPPIPFPGAQIRDEEAPAYDGRRPRREPFTMIPRRILEEHAAKVGIVAWGVFTALVHHADQDGRCFPSRKRVADLLGIHPNSVTEAVRRLAAAGLVEREARRTDGGAQTSNGYRIPCLCPTPRTEGGTPKDEPPYVQGVAPLRPGRSKQEPVNENYPNEGDAPPNPPGDPKPRRRQLTSWPDGFDLDDRRRAVAVAAGVDPERQWQRFRDYCDAHDKRYRDWDAAWRNWVTSPYQGNGRAPSGSGSRPAPYGNGVRPFSEWSDDELLRWSPPPGHRGGVPGEVRMARIRRLQAQEAGQ